MTSRPREVSEILALIRRLYAFERIFRDLPAEVRQQQRQTKVRPVVDAIFKRVEDMKPTTLPAEPLRKAIGYVLNQRGALRRFLKDGRLEADNNTAENAIRTLALGRNYVHLPIMRRSRVGILRNLFRERMLTLMDPC